MLPKSKGPDAIPKRINVWMELERARIGRGIPNGIADDTKVPLTVYP